MKTSGCSSTIRPARYRAGLLAGFLLLTNCVAAQDAFVNGQVRSADRTSDLVVELQDDLITLRVRNARLRDVLAELVGHCDLSIVSHAALDDRITLELERMALAEVLVRIMRDQSYLLQQTPANCAAPKGRTPGGTLWVFSNASSNEPGYSLSAASMAVEMLRAQLRSDDVRVRQDAIKALRRLDAEEAVGALSDALADEDRKTRVKAIYALADIGGDDAAAVLATGLADENPYVRAESVYALGALGSDSAIPILKHALNDADSHVRESAISAFTEIGGSQSAEALAVALHDSDPALRVEAVEALRIVGGETAVRLLNIALQDQDDTVREAARGAFAGLSRQQNL